MKGLAAAVLIVSGSAAQAQSCVDMYQIRSVVGLPQFYREEFGMVGFSPDEGRHVYIVDDDSVCITVPRRLGTKLRFYFNNRHADDAETGYVSFKLYGMSNATAASSTLALHRTGDWKRGAAPMKPPVWKQIKNNQAPAMVQNYEAAYRDSNPISEKEFDDKFGALHGQPAGNQSADSWNDRADMQPEDTTIKPANIAYLAHSLQRVQANPQLTGDSVTPSFVTDQMKRYDTLVMRSFSPLGQDGKSTTLMIRLGD